MPLGGLLIGGLGTLASGILGHAANMSAQDRAAMLQQKGIDEWLKVNVPDPEQQKLALQQFIQQGTLSPAFEQAVKANPSEFEKITQDPSLKESRMRALSALQEQGYGGEQIQDTAARQQAIIDSGAANRGRSLAATGAMERRGQLGSGLELASRLDNAQAEGDRLAKNSLDIESQRRQRALQSVMGAGDLAGDIQKQDFNQQSAEAQAKDAISKFNTQMLASTNQRNTDRMNAGQEYNLGNAQAIADKNVGVNNMQQQYNKELLQQKFQNDASKAAGMSGQYNNQAEGAINQGKNAASMWGNIASGVGQTALGASKLASSSKTSNPNLYDWTGEDPDKDKAYV